MKVADLRKSILQAAMQGKLVPQDKNDESASELLMRIQAEKAALVKEGKLKKEKPLPPITEDEIPCDLPEGWIWCRLNQIADSCLGKMLDSVKNKGSYYPYLRNLNVQWFHFDLSDVLQMRFEEKEFDRYSVVDGDVVICEGGYPGTAAIWKSDKRLFIQKALHRVRFFTPATNYFFLYYLNFLFITEKLSKYYTGTGIQHLTGKALNEIPIPLPPLAEQQRIVAKVDELMALCDELEAAEKELDTIETHFAEYLPKSILQAAVQGKLVPQDKSDEPASELLKRMQTEKAKLIKEGKLKKETLLPPITEDEIPYDLPEGWVWCRLGEIMHGNVGGGTPSKQRAEYWNGNIPWASVKDLNCDILTTTQDTITELGLRESASNLIPADSIIVCMRMGLGKIVISAIPVAINQDLRALYIPKDKILGGYFIYWYKTLIIDGGGMTVKGITISDLSNMLFPLSPLAEQQRIVAKVDELMALCDELKHVGEQPIDYNKVIQFPAEAEVETEPLQMAAQGKVFEQPSKKHAAALDDLVEMMDDD